MKRKITEVSFTMKVRNFCAELNLIHLYGSRQGLHTDVGNEYQISINIPIIVLFSAHCDYLRN